MKHFGEMKKLGDVVLDMHQGLNTAGCKIVFVETGYPIIQSQNIESGKIDFTEKIKYMSSKDWSIYKNKYKPSIGDVLFSNIGTIGKTAVVTEEKEYLIHWNIFIFKPKRNIIDPYYLRYFLDSTTSTEYFNSFQKGGTVNFITKKIIDNMPILLPPLAEQKRIAAILDKADAIRRKRQEAIRLADELLRSVFLDMFGDPVTNPKGWEVKTIKDVCTKVTDGTHHVPKRENQGIPMLRVLNIKQQSIDTKDLYYISEDDYKKIEKRSPLAIGDVLLTCLGTVGNTAIFNLPEKYTLVRNIALLKPNYTVICSEFLHYVLRTSYLQSQIKQRIKQSSQGALYLGEIQELKLYVPNLGYQSNFSKFFHKVQNNYSKQKFLNQDSENLFNSLVQRAFRGEL